MARHRLSLDGVWDFQFDAEGNGSLDNIASWRTIAVPMPWQAQFPHPRESNGTAWYRRTFTAPLDWPGRAAVLHFGAVGYHAQVWLNGQRLGEHEGSYLPFEFEVSGHLRTGASNDLVVRATSPSDDPARFPDFPFSEIPHGKQSWYGVLGGIWQPVWIEARAPFHIVSLRLAPSLESGVVRVRATFSTPAPESAILQMCIRHPDEAVATSDQVTIPAGATTHESTLTVPDPLPWSPDAPHLYHLEAETAGDALGQMFGFRTIAARDGQLFLNGERLYLRGALDQDYYPGTISTPPSEAFLEEQFRQAKAMGLNCLRCHIKIPDPRYYDVADRVGMLVWVDLPNAGRFTERSRLRLEDTLRGMVERDWHHPSIIAWSIINEDWGTDLVHNSTHRAWLKRMVASLKDLDPTRLVVDNSACVPNFHLQTDLEDFHIYRAFPDHREQWDEVITAFAARPGWTFSPHGDAVRTGQEPLIMSEFGTWGLPDTDNLLEADGQEPWWFETGWDWGEGITYPHGIQRRFYALHLDQVFRSWRAFVEATQWHQFNALKYQIETLRRHAAIAGYVITELTDVYWEANGLLDLRRNPKAFYTALADLNADTVIIPDWKRTAYWAGEPVRIGLVVAYGAGQPAADCYIEWRFDGEIQGQMPVPDLATGQVQAIGEVEFMAPDVNAPVRQRLQFILRAANGNQLAANHLPLTILPQRAGPVANVTLWTPDDELGERLTALGYRLAPKRQGASAVVTHTLEQELTAYIREGGRVLLLADRDNAIRPCAPGPQVIEPCFPYAQLIRREDTFWAGDWVSSFSWLKRQGPFARLPGGPLLDHSFDRVIPDHVLVGFGAQDHAAFVHAGLFLGWIHKPVALIARRHYGQGAAVLTTFRLTRDAPGSDPVATVLLDALIESAIAAG